MFAQSKSAARQPPSGQVWATYARMRPEQVEQVAEPQVGEVGELVWHYVLSVDVKTPWKISGADFFPPIPAATSADAAAAESDAVSPEPVLANGGTGGWVAHEWFTGHGPTPCLNGSQALASGCVAASVRSASDVPALHTTRPIVVANDTRTFDLLQLSPVAPNGWVLLGEVGRYVRVSSDRFDAISFPVGGGIKLSLSGSAGETTEVTALKPLHRAPNDGGWGGGGGSREWVVEVKQVTFSAATATVAFGGEQYSTMS